MSCPFAPAVPAAGPDAAGAPPAAARAGHPAAPLPAAPLAGPLAEAYPDAVLARHRCVEDPAAVRAILGRPEDFAPDNALTTAVPLAPAALRLLAAGRFSLPPVLASASGPAHLAVRRVVARFFSPAKVAAQSGPIRELVRGTCSGLRADLEAGAAVDLAAAVAAPVPPAIMAALTGVPTPPLEVLKRWSRDSLELFWGWPGAGRQLELAHSAAAFHAWLGGSVDRATAAGGNLFAALRDAGVDRDRIRSLGYFLVIAGQETTAMLAQTALATALAGGRWAECADAASGPAASRDVVRGVLARSSSVPTWRRRATVDAEVGGERFRAGEHLVLRLSGGALGDAGDGSLAFGFGLHRCLGAGLAELEAALILEECARALPRLALGGEPEWAHLLSFQAPTTVPVRWAPSGAGVPA